eukprot:1553271-Rhodomonas_salina.1
MDGMAHHASGAVEEASNPAQTATHNSTRSATAESHAHTTPAHPMLTHSKDRVEIRPRAHTCPGCCCQPLPCPVACRSPAPTSPVSRPRPICAVMSSRAASRPPRTLGR